MYANLVEQSLCVRLGDAFLPPQLPVQIFGQQLGGLTSMEIQEMLEAALERGA